MARSTYSTTIEIDSERSVFHFYSMRGNDKSTISHSIKNYASGPMDEMFFEKFKEAVKAFAEDNPSQSVRKVTVILPDSAVLTDVIKVATMKGLAQTQKTLDNTLKGLFRNYSNMQITSCLADQNKQYTTFAISAVQKQLVSSIYAACAENKLLVDMLTVASSATACGATLLNSKLKGASYLFLDIKDVYSRFVFVVNGNTVGSYILPFGLEFLQAPQITQEDMLFDHSYAEMMLFTAKERARSQKIAAEGDAGEQDDDASDDEETSDEEKKEETEEKSENAESEEAKAENADSEEAKSESAEDEDDEDEEDDDETAQENAEGQVSMEEALKKTPRKLPKFMLRDIPETEEGIACENFRVFVKWALSLIQGNGKLMEIGKPEFVCVNLPKDMEFVLDKINEEEETNVYRFVRLPYENEVSEVVNNLELYGGLHPKQICWTGQL